MSNGWQRSVIMLSSSARFICRGKNVVYSPLQNSRTSRLGIAQFDRTDHLGFYYLSL